MKVKLLSILTALVLGLTQFFVYPIFADEEASGSGEIEIIDNGSDSDNASTLTEDIAANATQNNSLKLNNNIQINASTGENEALDNDGNVTIITGKVNSSIQVLNHNLNSSYLTASNPNPRLNSKILGNGTESTSGINESFAKSQEFLVNNHLSLNNNVKNYGSSGGNKASRNTGTIFISSGNVYLAAILSNGANFSNITQPCCLISLL